MTARQPGEGRQGAKVSPETGTMWRTIAQPTAAFLDLPSAPHAHGGTSLGKTFVVLVNSDLVDTLRVEPLPFPHSGFSDMGHFCSGTGLLLHSGRSSEGGGGSSPSTQRAAALGEATQADLCGSISLGPVVAVLERRAVGLSHRETGDGDWLAPQRV